MATKETLATDPSDNAAAPVKKTRSKPGEGAPRTTRNYVFLTITDADGNDITDTAKVTVNGAFHDARKAMDYFASHRGEKMVDFIG